MRYLPLPLFFHFASGLELPKQPPRLVGLGISRREVGQVGAIFSVLSSRKIAERPALASTNHSPQLKLVTGRSFEGDIALQCQVPSNWYVSQGGKGRTNGALLSAGDYQTGTTISIVETSVAALTKGDPFVGTGLITNFFELGLKPLALADALVRLRDGDIDSPVRLGSSFAVSARWVAPVRSTKLDGFQADSAVAGSSQEEIARNSRSRLVFEATTLVTQGVSGAAGFNK